MSQTVGAFVPLQQRNAYERPACLTGNGQLPRFGNPGMFVGGPAWDPRYVSGYQGYKFYNPSFAGGYEGEKFYNPGEWGGYEDNPCAYMENPPWPGSVAPMPVVAGPWPGSTRPSPERGRPWPGSVRASNPMDEGTVVVEKTVFIKHPRTHKTHKVSVVSVRGVAPGMGEVVVDRDYVMLWDMANNRPWISTAQACPVGYRLYGGRCFRKARGGVACKTDADCPQKPCATTCVEYVNGKYDPQCLPVDPLCGMGTFSAAPGAMPGGVACKTDADCPQKPCATTCVEYVNGKYDPQCLPVDPLCGMGTFSAAPGAMPGAPPPPGYPDPFPPQPPPTCAWGYEEWCKLCEEHGGNITLGGDCKLPDGHIVAKPSKPPAPAPPKTCPPGYTPTGPGGGCVDAEGRPPRPIGWRPPGIPAPMPRGIARAAAVREENPRHPVYLNRLSLPWQYPWTYTHNPNTLSWGYVHPRWGYATPWRGWGGWYPNYAGRAYYDDRVVCERVAEDESCPTGTVVERDRDGSKLCCEQEGPNPWYPAWTYPYYIWWCPTCGYYPRRHHRHHRHHGAHGGPRGGGGAVIGRGGGMIRTGGGVRGGGGGAIGSGGGGIRTGGGASNNPGDIEEISEVAEEYEENPITYTIPTKHAPVQPWDMAGPCPPGTVRMGGACQAPAPPTLPPPEPVPPPPPPPGPAPIPPTGKPVPPIGTRPQAPQQPARPSSRPMAAPAMQRPMQRPMTTRTQAPRAQAAMRGTVRR